MKYIPIILLFLVSCRTVKKAVRTFDEHPEAASLYCADRFPVVDTVIVGDTIVTTDTIYGIDFIHDSTTVAGDTVFRLITKPVTVTKYITRTDTIVKENTARLTAKDFELQKTKDALVNNNAVLEKWRSDYYGMRDKRNKWRLWFWVAVGAVGMYTFLKIRKLIPF